MNSTSRQLKLASGIFVTIVSLFSISGCGTVHNTSMAAADLNYFQVNCKLKAEQIVMLQSMRASPDEQLIARVSNAVQPWQVITNKDAYNQKQQIGSSRTNWLINQHLMALVRQVTVQMICLTC